MGWTWPPSPYRARIETTLTDTFDVSSRWPLDGVVVRDASIQLIGYPENIRIIDSAERSVVFNAWGALDFIEDFNEREIILTYDPEKVVSAPTKPPLGYNRSGCSGGPAIVHEIRSSGFHIWHPVGLIVGGPKCGERDAAEFDIIRTRWIDCIQPDGHIERDPDTGYPATIRLTSTGSHHVRACPRAHPDRRHAVADRPASSRRS